jgi:NAD(P)-dependent dehydrogenase (short-subunit alcohol dehydrogenase family)
MAGFSEAPACTAYAASKFAVEGLSEALAKEISGFGIRVMLIELGSFRTNLVTNLKLPASQLRDYEGTPAKELVKLQQEMSGRQPGDPVKAAKRVIEVITKTAGDVLSEKENVDVLRVFLGRDSIAAGRLKIKTFDESLSTQEGIAQSTDFE